MDYFLDCPARCRPPLWIELTFAAIVLFGLAIAIWSR